MTKKDFKRKDNFYVYIIRCANGTYYTGYTNNLENRIIPRFILLAIKLGEEEERKEKQLEKA